MERFAICAHLQTSDHDFQSKLLNFSVSTPLRDHYNRGRRLLAAIPQVVTIGPLSNLCQLFASRQVLCLSGQPNFGSNLYYVNPTHDITSVGFRPDAKDIFNSIINFYSATIDLLLIAGNLLAVLAEALG